MERKQVELPTTDEIKEWVAVEFARLNQDYVPYLLMGVEALYVKLGGDKFIEVRMPEKHEQ